MRYVKAFVPSTMSYSSTIPSCIATVPYGKRKYLSPVYLNSRLLIQMPQPTTQTKTPSTPSITKSEKLKYFISLSESSSSSATTNKKENKQYVCDVIVVYRANRRRNNQRRKAKKPKRSTT